MQLRRGYLKHIITTNNDRRLPEARNEPKTWEYNSQRAYKNLGSSSLDRGAGVANSSVHLTTHTS
jgi:hypothetical protein